MKNNFFLSFYYLTLSVLVLSALAYNLYQGSLRVVFARRLAKLQKEEIMLTKEKHQLWQQYAQEKSLLAIKEKIAEDNFQPLRPTYFLNQQRTVAFKN